MPLPVHISEALERSRLASKLPGSLASNVACQGAAFHSPNPLLLQKVSLVPAEWGIEDRTTVLLCGTCQANLAVALEIFRYHHGEVPWEIAREFGNQIRALAKKAWASYERAQSRSEA